MKKIFVLVAVLLIASSASAQWVQSNGVNLEIVMSFTVRGSDIFAGTGNGAYKSTNDGVTWTQTSLNNRDIMSLAVSENILFAGTYVFGIYKSTDNGSTWVQTSLTNGTVLTLLVSGNCIFAGTKYCVYKSTDNGSTWIQTSLIYRYVNSLAESGSNIFAGTWTYGVYLSTDNGNTWIQKNQGFENININIISLMINDNYIFAGTWENSAWRRDLDEIISVKNINGNIPDKYVLHQNYPNLFNPNTNIKIVGCEIDCIRCSRS